MKILADENIDRSIVEYLRSAGHDVVWMSQHAPGADDEIVMSLAQSEQRVIITFDRDYGELLYHQHKAAVGVIYLRIDAISPEYLLTTFVRAWTELESKVLGCFIVVSNDRIRIRPLPIQ